MASVIDSIMRGHWQRPQIALLLTGLRAKGETVAEVAGAAAALRAHMTPIRTIRQGLVDTCGTGGDAAGTFNISTAAALVTAAAGVPVAKHGNRKVSSRSGSADVLRELGVNIEADVPVVQRCLDELGIGFCFAPLLHPAMKHVAEVRRELGVPTIFNLLGPLSNPASAPYQVLGVGRPELRPLLAEALASLGTRHALVVHGQDGLDEVTLSGPTLVSEVRGEEVTERQWHPAEFGLECQSLEAALVDGPESSAALIRHVLEGHPGAARDLVLLNAAAAIWTAGQAPTLRDAAQRAAEAIDSGRARQLLARLAAVSHGR
ncbi:MAG: anthranilate phosphoribosyltransferase [Pirellulaceae bacterium]|nr:anthranilate phosphoribosyltransferase [Pirellulaceae bacterium]